MKRTYENGNARENYRPGPAGGAAVEKTQDLWTLVFVRDLKHPPENVWRALTGRDELRAWAPFDADRDLGKAGAVTLTTAGAAETMNSSCTVAIAERPRVLEYTWEHDVLRWELEPSAAGTRLTLRHTLADRNFVPKIAAGWQICLDVAEHLLDGNPIGRIVAKDALDFEWERLNDEYAQRFGIENTGVPETIAGR